MQVLALLNLIRATKSIINGISLISSGNCETDLYHKHVQILTVEKYLHFAAGKKERLFILSQVVDGQVRW